jgi:hypothetical protein
MCMRDHSSYCLCFFQDVASAATPNKTASPVQKESKPLQKVLLVGKLQYPQKIKRFASIEEKYMNRIGSVITVHLVCNHRSTNQFDALLISRQNC